MYSLYYLMLIVIQPDTVELSTEYSELREELLDEL